MQLTIPQASAARHRQRRTAMAETNLGRLLAHLDPELHPGHFVFLTLPSGRYGDFAELEPVGAFVEAEGLTLVVEEDAARNAGLSIDSVWRMITLNAHSDLAAVGLTARVAAALAGRDISANLFAAYHHDHLFVADADATRAVAVLRALQRSAGG